MERLCSWPSWISARTRSHSEKGPERSLGSPDHGCDGETVSPFPQSNCRPRQVSFASAGGRSSAGSISDRRAGTPPAVEDRLASISAMARVFRDRDDEKSAALVRQIAERLVKVRRSIRYW